MNKLNWHELTLENVGQWPRPFKVGMFLGASMLSFALGYWLLIQDNFVQYERLKAQELSLKVDFENKQAQLFNLEEYRQQLAVMNKRFASMLKQLPAKNEMPGLLEEISKTGLAAGLKFTLFAPQAELRHDFYVELPIKISVVGSYFQLAQFLSRVAEVDRIVTWHEFSIEGVSSKAQQMILDDALVMNITAKIYRYRT
jgi:type IV pilus assembly protein PilO